MFHHAHMYISKYQKEEQNEVEYFFKCIWLELKGPNLHSLQTPLVIHNNKIGMTPS